MREYAVMLKPRRAAAGDRVAVVAPASPFSARRVRGGARGAAPPRLRAGVRATRLRPAGLRGRRRPEMRAAALSGALADPGIARDHGGARRLRQRPGAAVARPGARCAAPRKPIVGYSDLTSLLTFVSRSLRASSRSTVRRWPAAWPRRGGVRWRVVPGGAHGARAARASWPPPSSTRCVPGEAARPAARREPDAAGRVARARRSRSTRRTAACCSSRT